MSLVASLLRANFADCCSCAGFAESEDCGGWLRIADFHLVIPLLEVLAYYISHGEQASKNRAKAARHQRLHLGRPRARELTLGGF